MSKDEREKPSDEHKGLRFAGLVAPIHDREAYEEQMGAFPPSERALVEELTRHADLCRYFEEKRMQVPPHIVRAVRKLASLSPAERAAEMREINHELMEYLQSVSDDSELRM